MKPRPSKGFKTFSIWYYYRKDSQLNPAGLVWSVRMVTQSVIKTVEASVRNGKVVLLKIFPESWQKDIVISLAFME